MISFSEGERGDYVTCDEACRRRGVVTSEGVERGVPLWRGGPRGSRILSTAAAGVMNRESRVLTWLAVASAAATCASALAALTIVVFFGVVEVAVVVLVVEQVP